MAKGNKAKERITRLIVDALGQDFISISDKKIYAWAQDEGNERVQIAISMTMPKVQVGAETQVTTGAPWEDSPASSMGNNISAETELSPGDKAQVERLKDMLREKGVYQE